MTVIILELAGLICGVGCGGLLTLEGGGGGGGVVWGGGGGGGGGGRSARDRVSKFQISRGWHICYRCYSVMASKPRKMEYKRVV